MNAMFGMRAGKSAYVRTCLLFAASRGERSIFVTPGGSFSVTSNGRGGLRFQPTIESRVGELATETTDECINWPRGDK